MDSTQEMGMFGLGWPEVAIIGLIAIVIFGPKKIPEMGSALGKTLRGFKDEMNKPPSDKEDDDQDSV
jgi:sec-independent protein translocase protein TatA